MGTNERTAAILPAVLGSLKLAVEADPTAAVLVSKLYLVQRAAGRCEDAAETGKRLIRLVPQSEKAKAMVMLPCGENQ